MKIFISLIIGVSALAVYIGYMYLLINYDIVAKITMFIFAIFLIISVTSIAYKYI